MTAVTVATAVVSTPRAALATAAVYRALHTGFVLNRYGELAFDFRSGSAAPYSPRPCWSP